MQSSFFCLAFLLVLAYARTQFSGVNLAGLDFGPLPGVYNKDYTSPTTQEVDYYLGKKFNAFRLPFLWERLQPVQNGPFSPTYLGYISNIVNYATSRGAYVLLDPHNYARYYGKVIGEADVPVLSFQHFWAQLAKLFMANPRVIFGLMNEPNTMKTELWLEDANAAIAAIRSVGATNLITVPGNAWTGAGSWFDNWYGTPNAIVMKGVKDPGNNFVFEVHQYLDSDGSGTHPECVSPQIGVNRLTNFTLWCQQYKYKAWLGEWAGGRNAQCYDAITNTLNYVVKSSPDVYVGWTWWAGGPWWGEYMYTLDPTPSGQDRPQLQYLTPFLTYPHPGDYQKTN